MTSAAGVVTFLALAATTAAASRLTGLPASPWASAAWPVPYTGARLQSRMPDLVIRRLIGALVVATGIRYLRSGLDR